MLLDFRICDQRHKIGAEALLRSIKQTTVNLRRSNKITDDFAGLIR